MKSDACHFEHAKSLVSDSRIEKFREKSIWQRKDSFKKDRPLTTFPPCVWSRPSLSHVRGDRCKAIIISILLLLLFQCSMKSADIRNGEYLGKAQETSVEDFFQKRMKNRIRKVMGANWEILFESSEFIYYGYPVIEIFREGTFLDKFFKVDRSKLESDFPSYKEFDGIFLRRRCYDLLSEQDKTNLAGLSRSFDCTAVIEADSILVSGNILYRTQDNQIKTEKYLIRFDKRNLKKETITKLGE